MWLWLRELEISKQAALFGAVSFTLSLCFAHWFFFPQTAFSLWPWMLFLLERLRDARGRVRATVALTIVLVCAALAGHPESAALGGLFAGLWILGRRAVGDFPDAAPVLRRAAVSALLAAGLTAFLLIPSILAIGASNRLRLVEKPHWDPILSVAPHGPLWRGVPTAFFPHALGNAIASPTLAGGTGAFPEMALGYFGIVGWAAALLVLRGGRPRRRFEWVLAALLICGFGVAVGQWPFAELMAQVPGIRLIFPLRFYLWIALAGSGPGRFRARPIRERSASAEPGLDCRSPGAGRARVRRRALLPVVLERTRPKRGHWRSRAGSSRSFCRSWPLPPRSRSFCAAGPSSSSPRSRPSAAPSSSTSGGDSTGSTRSPISFPRLR